MCLRGSRAQAKIQILDLKKVKGISISLTFFVEVEVIKGRTRYFRHLTSRCGLNTGPSIKNGRAEIYKIQFMDENLGVRVTTYNVGAKNMEGKSSKGRAENLGGGKYAPPPCLSASNMPPI